MMTWLRGRLSTAPIPPSPQAPVAAPAAGPIPASVPVPERQDDGPPLTISLEQRTRMATLCRDCDALPKVAAAGSVVSEADGSRVQIMHNGLRVAADGYCGAWMTDLIARCRGHHEPQEERAFAEIIARLPDDASMIELGGWWAFYTLWFLQDRPHRRAVVLEPDPVHRAVGEANARLNHAAPIFVDGFAGATSAPPGLFHTESGDAVTIPRQSVPQLMRDHGLDRLDLLHCDAQGAELDVLRGSEALLRAGSIRTVIVSTHHWLISGDPLTHQRCLDFVIAAGGRVLAEHDVHESFSGDGLIVARFGADAADWPAIPLSHNRYSTSLFRNPLYDLAHERAV